MCEGAKEKVNAILQVKTEFGFFKFWLFFISFFLLSFFLKLYWRPMRLHKSFPGEVGAQGANVLTDGR